MKITFRNFKAPNNEKSLECTLDNKNSFLIHSGQNPSKEGAQWAGLFTREEKTAYIVLGCGLGYQILEFQKNLPPNSKVIAFFSQAERALIQQKEQRRQLQVLEHADVVWIEAATIFDLSVGIAEKMLKYRLKKIRLCPYRPAMNIDMEFYKECEEELVNKVERALSGILNVKFWNGKVFVKNFCLNLKKIVRTPGVDRISNLFSFGVPAVVVGSGPSLDKNIDVLRTLQDDVVIIAAGSAMKALAKAGITPHFLCVADAAPIMYNVLKDSFLEETILVSSVVANSDVIKYYPGEILFFMSSDAPPLHQVGPYLPKTRQLLQAVSVSTLAIDFARICGARKIVLVGQDLAYQGDKHHAEGVETTAYCGKDFFEVPGYYGGTVITYPQLSGVIDFISAYAKNSRQIKFINSTEGGAYISGIENEPLYKLACSIKIKGEGKNIQKKAFTLIKTFKLRKREKLIEKIEQLITNLIAYSNLMKEATQIDLNIPMTQQLQAYEKLFFENATAGVMELLENMITPRLQAINFYSQELNEDKEVCEMYKGVVHDLEKFCLEIAGELKEVIDVLEREADCE